MFFRGGRKGESRVTKASLIEGEDARGSELREEGEVVIVSGDVFVEASGGA